MKKTIEIAFEKQLEIFNNLLQDDVNKIIHKNIHDLIVTYKSNDIENLIEHISKLDIETKKAIINPYVLGMGNPFAKILIVGQESGYDISVDNNSNYIDECFKFPLELYNNKDKKEIRVGYEIKSFVSKTNYSDTWANYSKLYKTISETDENDFLKHTFILELSHYPASKQKGLKYDKNQLSRLQFLRDLVFPNFEIIIFATGNYISPLEIMLLTNSYLADNKSSSGKKLIFFKNDKQKIINCRQLSNAFKNELFYDIKNLIKQ
jgi:hypothetical protein